MQNKTKVKMSSDIKQLMSYFDRVGIATKDCFSQVKVENHPNVIQSNFESIIVFAQGSHSTDTNAMGAFDDYFGAIAAQSDVLEYLHQNGYESNIIVGTSKQVSLVKMGIEAGLGEISPVDSLVIKGLGLTASLGAIITNAPLVADEKVTNVCINCMKCLRVCPIRDIPNAEGDLSKCACGKCKNLCPV